MISRGIPLMMIRFIVLLAIAIGFGFLAGLVGTAVEMALLLSAVIFASWFALTYKPLHRRLIRQGMELDAPGIKERMKAIGAAMNIVDVPIMMVPGKSLKFSQAFVSGIHRPVIYITDYLYENLQDDEIVGILCHELGHVKNGDLVTRTVLGWIQVAFLISLANLFIFELAVYITLPGGFVAAAFLDILLLVIPLIMAASMPAIRRRQENLADTFAVREAGFSSAALSILKAHRLNNLPIGARSRSHPQIPERINLMELSLPSKK